MTFAERTTLAVLGYCVAPSDQQLDGDSAGATVSGAMPFGPALVGLRPEPASSLGHSATIDYRGGER